MKIGIIGANGFLGKVLQLKLAEYFNEVVGITKVNYTSYLGKYDIIINANGNSKKFWANNNPVKDFDSSVVSVYKSLFDFPCSKYIFISSADVYTHPVVRPVETCQIDDTTLSPYGFNKLLAENIVRKYAQSFLILRSSAIVGKDLVKGVVKDILSGNELFVTPDSCIQCISNEAVADIIKELLFIQVKDTTINIGGIGTTSVNYMTELSKTVPLFSFDSNQIFPPDFLTIARAI